MWDGGQGEGASSFQLCTGELGGYNMGSQGESYGLCLCVLQMVTAQAEDVGQGWRCPLNSIGKKPPQTLGEAVARVWRSR